MKKFWIMFLSMALGKSSIVDPNDPGRPTEQKTVGERRSEILQKTKNVFKEAGSFVAVGAVIAFFGACLGAGTTAGSRWASRKMDERQRDNDDTMTTGQAGQRGGQARQRAA